MDREQIIKGLECWTSEYGCTSCPFIEQGCFDCGHIPIEISKSILALINSQEQRIKELTEENERLRAENAKYEAENHAEFNKWLKLEEATKRHHAELFEEAKIAVKEDTVRKMQEQLKTEIEGFGKKDGFVSKEVIFWFIDQIAKEMLEGK